MAEDGAPESGVAASGEQVHLPGPSFLPVLVAAGVTIALVGVITAWPIVVVGFIIFFIPLVRWIRDIREDIAELPIDH